MKTFLCLVLVSMVSCTTLLKNPPSNADINCIYENNKLVEVEIDYRNDLRPIIKSVPIAAPAAPIAAVAKSGGTKTYYKVDDGQLERVKPTHVGYSALPVAPAAKSVHVAPAAPVPVVKKSGATKTYYKVDDGQLERVKPTHVGYSVLPETPAVPVVKSAPAPAPVVPAPAPAPVSVKAAPEPLRITGPQVILKQAPAPTARSVIIEGPKVIYKRIGPAPVAAPAPAPAPAPVVMVKSAPATPVPASPLIKTFWKQDDGELEKIIPTHVSYSLVKPAPVPVPVPVAAPVPIVPVAAPAPVFYSLPTPAQEDESIEEED